jgi:hypothetical protein
VWGIRTRGGDLKKNPFKKIQMPQGGEEIANQMVQKSPPRGRCETAIILTIEAQTLKTFI